MSTSTAATQRPPDEPELRVLRRGRVVLGFDEASEQQAWAGDAWFRIEGSWLVLFADEIGHWQIWPAHAVICVDDIFVEPFE